MKLLSLIALLFCALATSAQNQKNDLGQRFGLWIDTVTTNNGYWVSQTGHFKIISDNKYLIVDTFIHNTHRDAGNRTIKYNGHHQLQYYYSKRDSTISVMNGLWSGFDSLGKTIDEAYYIDGMIQWTKKYNEDGELSKHTMYTHDSTVDHYYLDGRVFLKEWYSPNDGNQQMSEYYPNDNLYISNAIINLHANYNSKPFDTIKVLVTTKKPDTINKIVLPSEQLQILDKDLQQYSFPIILDTRSTHELNIIYTPNKNSPEIFDKTIRLFTNCCEYYIFVNAYTSHIDQNSFWNNDTITISKSEFEILRIDKEGLGFPVSLHITKNEDTIYDYSESHYTEYLNINISKIKPDTYNVSFGNCDIVKELTLIITE